MTMRVLLRWAVGVAFGVAGPVAWADQVTLTAARDTNLIQTLPADPQMANGGDDSIFVGRTNQGDGADRRRGLLAFDLSSIPAGSTITAVTFSMTLNRTRGGASQTRLHRALQNWGEGTAAGTSGGGGGGQAGSNDATWYCPYFPSSLWNTVGGDYVATASATTTVSGSLTTYTWTSAQLVADVQGWLNNPATNFGWFIIGDESSGQTAKRFNSRENASTGQRPRLVVTFTPPGAVGACCIPIGCTITSATQCAVQSGTYQGDGSVCTPNPCPDAVGACCQNNGTCQIVTQVGCAQLGGTYRGDGTLCTAGQCPIVLIKYVDPLPRPGVALPLSGLPGGAATYRITMTQFVQRLHRDLPLTTVWGYNGTFPGPTIEASSNQQVIVTWVNDLREPGGGLRTTHYLPVDTCLHGPDVTGQAPKTVVHLHGGHVPPASDGYPESSFGPGQEVTYVYQNNQQAAPLWYHDHALGLTRLNVYMGLAGFYFIRDSVENAIPLPAGEFELPMVIQDRKFTQTGQLEYPAQWQEDFFGDTILVNGKVWPYLNVKQGKYRLRLLNGSNSRVYTLSLSNGLTFTRIGTDGGLLSEPVVTPDVTIAPGERCDVIVNFQPLAAGTEVFLTNSAPAPFPGPPGVGVVPEVMKFIVQAQPGYTAAIPATLRPVPPPDLLRVSQQRDFHIRSEADVCTGSKWLINGLMWDDVTETVRLNSVEIWSFINRSPMMHPMHMHLVQFQILDRQDFVLQGDQVVTTGPRVPPPAWEAGWKDTVQSYPLQITRVIAKFTEHTGLFPYHCHLLEHEDNEMMRQFRANCESDWDSNGRVEPADIAAYINQWQADVNNGTRITDTSGNGTVEPLDVSFFVNRWFSALLAGNC